MKKLNKILIANRGEIAVRIMRTCSEMGISTVAVYSEADWSAPHVKIADEAYCIGGSAARDSYLKGDVIIKTALESGAEAIHPGYGFLAENADFAEMVTDAGLVFIGPPPCSIRSMGSKTQARKVMMTAGVPIVPGDEQGLESHEEALSSAERIGYPVLIKAAAGGGGKGMRVVWNPEDLPDAMDGARREALSSFSNDEVYLEKFIEGPRHIEVQVLADQHGNVIHLYERECSIQRRHQKVIEEAPSPALADFSEIKEAMGKAAVAATKACGYVNAGTVEFLFDPNSSDFYFLEMNTRLQVEHPVTEMVTGIDLVREQILIAEGHPLQIQQEDVQHRGHSIEVRIYAENVPDGFLPDAGTVIRHIRPDGPWVRVDSGVSACNVVGVHYDPLIAKLIVWGPDRLSAIRRMHRALSEYRIIGLKTTIPFAGMVMENKKYISGDFNTRFIEQEYQGKPVIKIDESTTKAAFIAAAIFKQTKNCVTVVRSPQENHRKNRVPENGWKLSGRRRGIS